MDGTVCAGVQCVAVCCSVLQCVTVCCSDFGDVFPVDGTVCAGLDLKGITRLLQVCVCVCVCVGVFTKMCACVCVMYCEPCNALQLLQHECVNRCAEV